MTYRPFRALVHSSGDLMPSIAIRQLSHLRRAGVIVLVTALVVAPSAAFAVQHFSDVPDGAPFATEINAVADAGVAAGFPDGTYHPTDAVKRQAMAAFLYRGFGRVGAGSGGVSLGNPAPASTRAVVASAAMQAGAAGAAATGFVQLDATFQAMTGYLSACPCQMEFSLQQDGSTVGTTRELAVPNTGTESGVALADGAMQVVVPIVGSTARSFQLVAELQDSDVTTVNVTATLTAAYVPFGPDGDNTTTYEAPCPQNESEPNNTQPTANSMTPGCLLGAIDPQSDSDYLTFGISSGQTLRAETRSPEGVGCSGDTFLTLTNVGGTTVGINDDSGIGLCSLLTVSGLPTGTYYLKVTSFGSGESMPYRLTTALTSGSSLTTGGASRDTVTKDHPS
jgi:hypothetical protein